MTAPTPDLPNDALSAEERALAVQLARLDAGAGPSAALDARILAAAHAAVAPRRAQRWPALVGSMAIVVATVGLAWQFQPMFELPRPRTAAEEAAVRDGHGRHESEIVVQVDPPARRAPPPAAATAATDAAAAAPPPAAMRRAPPSGVARIAAPVPAEAPVRRAAPAAPAPVAVQESAAVAGAPAAAPMADAAASTDADTLDRVSVTGSRIRRPGPVPADYDLMPPDWLQRIRDRRAAGDVAGARDSLRRFALEHPHVEIPTDLRDLLPR